MRNIIVGKNSRVWAAAKRSGISAQWAVAIGHSELEGFEFLAGDRVWLFSYSSVDSENIKIIDRIQSASIEMLIYVSSSSAVVAESTGCYAYPRTKLSAERYASRVGSSRILTLGIVYETPSELPAGDNIATSIDSLVRFLLTPSWNSNANGRQLLFERIQRPFSSELERMCYKIYGFLINLFRSYPCVLRPLDLLLRYLNYRWYGYTYLSNRIWTQSTSS